MSYYTSRFNTGGVSYWSGSGPSSRTSYRPRFRPGRTRPDYDNLWFKYRKYLSGYNQQDITTDGTKIINVDFLKTENRTAHLTDEYVNTSLIVRRGQEFKLNIDVEVPFYKAQDTLQLFLSKGSAPQQSKGTLVRLDIYTDKKTAEQKQTSTPKWYGYLSSVTDKNIGAILSVVIKPPCNALAGKYDITTKVLAADLSGQRKRFVKEEQKEAVYVLFNAWCKDDQVYLKDEAERQEYVLNQTGKIWVGSSNYNVGRKWNFGQFEEYCLETAVYLLDKCQEITAQAHGNVTLVARALSAMANSNDNDGGILTGNWSGNYNGGTSPTAWVGSQAILEEYMVTKRNVRYGQCWVFSGLLTTLGRTLGIPTRSITNFESAHDNDNSLTIDSFVTANGDPINGIGDSVWNFHVWNESWFKRPDLPDGYDGWQAYDATPQEASEGIMRCGPVPVLAVKQGNVFYKYDGRFVFGEVNGDKVTWEINFETGDETPVSIDEKAVGKKISTKQVGSDERHDVTNNYKYEEGSSEERQAVARAAQYSSRDIVDFKYLDLQTSDVTFVYNDNTKPNGDVTITLEMTNTSSEIRHVTLSLTAVAAYYTGINAEELDKKKVEVILDPGQGTKSFTYIIVAKTDEWTILAVNYFKVIDADAKLKIYIMAKAAETKQVYTKIEMLELEKPDLNLLISKPKVAIGETFDLTINFTNPLDMTLTQGYIMLEGPGIQKNKKIYIHRSVPANGELSERVQLTPKYKGKKEIIASFNCKELSGIYGSVKMEVN